MNDQELADHTRKEVLKKLSKKDMYLISDKPLSRTYYKDCYLIGIKEKGKNKLAFIAKDNYHHRYGANTFAVLKEGSSIPWIQSSEFEIYINKDTMKALEDGFVGYNKFDPTILTNIKW